MLRGDSPVFSQGAAGNSGFPSSCDRDLRDPLVLPQESQVSIRVVKGLSGFPFSRYRGIEPHLELRLEPQGRSLVRRWLSGFLWSFNRGVSVETWKSAFLSRCKSGVRIPV